MLGDLNPGPLSMHSNCLCVSDIDGIEHRRTTLNTAYDWTMVNYYAIIYGVAGTSRRPWKNPSTSIHRLHFPLLRRTEFQSSLPETPWIDVDSDTNFVAKQVVHANDTVDPVSLAILLGSKFSHL